VLPEVEHGRWQIPLSDLHQVVTGHALNATVAEQCEDRAVGCAVAGNSASKLECKQTIEICVVRGFNSSGKGRRTINVANGSNTLGGTLHGWSLLIQPRNFSCQIFVPTDANFQHGL